jgi:hypothetical protein
MSPNRRRSCPRAKHLSRPSTSLRAAKDVDARHKAGHDEIDRTLAVELRYIESGWCIVDRLVSLCVERNGRRQNR